MSYSKTEEFLETLGLARIMDMLIHMAEEDLIDHGHAVSDDRLHKALQAVDRELLDLENVVKHDPVGDKPVKPGKKDLLQMPFVTPKDSDFISGRAVYFDGQGEVKELPHNNCPEAKFIPGVVDDYGQVINYGYMAYHNSFIPNTFLWIDHEGRLGGRKPTDGHLWYAGHVIDEDHVFLWLRYMGLIRVVATP